MCTIQNQHSLAFFCSLETMFKAEFTQESAKIQRFFFYNISVKNEITHIDTLTHKYINIRFIRWNQEFLTLRFYYFHNNIFENLLVTFFTKSICRSNSFLETLLELSTRKTRSRGLLHGLSTEKTPYN